MGRGKSDMGGLGVVECRKGNTDRAQNRALFPFLLDEREHISTLGLGRASTLSIWLFNSQNESVAWARNRNQKSLI
jgi:hypothetical protein